MMEQPLISVIVPVYNVEPYLCKCVDSILNQTYKNLEIILVDDGSPDNCPSICDKYVAQDSRICVIHQTNRGPSSARNAGLNIAKGQYIGFVDSDDWIEPTMYEAMLSLMLEKDLDVVFCAANIIENGLNVELRSAYQPSGTVLPKEEVIAKTICDEYTAYPVLKLYHRHCWEEVRFPEGRIFEDVSVAYLAYDRAQKPIGFLQEGLYNYIKNPTGLTFKRKSVTLYHLFLAKNEQLEYAKSHCPESASKCMALTARFALGTYADYYCNRYTELENAIPEVMMFLTQNRRELVANPHMEHGWGAALKIYYMSKSAFRTFYKVFTHLRGQL